MFTKIIKSFLFCLICLTTPLSAHAEWQIEEYGDAFDDHKRALAISRNTTGHSILVKCDGYMKDVYIQFYLNEDMGSVEEKEARIRFDKKEIITAQGFIYKSSFIITDSVGSAGKFDVKRLLEGFRTSQTVAIEVYTYDRDRVVASFPVAGFQEAESPVRATCKFPD